MKVKQNNNTPSLIIFSISLLVIFIISKILFFIVWNNMNQIIKDVDNIITPTPTTTSTDNFDLKGNFKILGFINIPYNILSSILHYLGLGMIIVYSIGIIISIILTIVNRGKLFTIGNFSSLFITIGLLLLLVFTIFIKVLLDHIKKVYTSKNMEIPDNIKTTETMMWIANSIILIQTILVTINIFGNVETDSIVYLSN